MTNNVRTYESLAGDGLCRFDCPTEADYHKAWKQYALPREPNLLEMALVGGSIADRLAWVFVSGYQAACRHAFSSAHLRSWVSHAASEDPKGKLPGVTLSGLPSEGTLSGYKVWIAAANTIEQVLVKVGSGSRFDYLLVDCDRPGISIDLFERDFLSSLSQGRIRFVNTPVSGADFVDNYDLGLLKRVEALYVYAAFCGFVLAGTTDGDLVSRGRACLNDVQVALASIEDGDLEHVSSREADARAQGLLARLQGNRLRAAGDWEADHKIVAMYSDLVDVHIPHGAGHGHIK